MRHDLNDCVKVVPNFPKEGVSFKDVSPLLLGHFRETVKAILDLIEPEKLEKIDAFVGLEARGFALASAMAYETNKGFVMARKAGKLPNPMASVSYDLEYGTAKIEMEAGSGNAWIVDDVLATGGTMVAAAELAEKVGFNVTGFSTLVNLEFLNNFEWKGMKCPAVLNYNAKGDLVSSPVLN